MTRDELLDHLDQGGGENPAPEWDVIVVGGGITGAGVFREACRRGYRTLLLEQRDFAWGTSSRSGKMVHGGLRYILQGQLSTSYHSVKEREHLLREYAGLVNPLTFVFAPPWKGFIIRLGTHLFLGLYDLMAGRRSHRYHREAELRELVPGLASMGDGGFSFVDGTTDDARLVLRVLCEGRALGGQALNYTKVGELLRDSGGLVRGVGFTDSLSQKSFEVKSKVVINATGAWADDLRQRLGHTPVLRRLRGSHLVFPHHRLPVDRAVGLRNPDDGRSMYVIPWEGVTLLGTTDLDHQQELDAEPRIAPHEGKYLLETANHWFPDAELTSADVMATQAGVRPVVNTGKSNPSKESREEVVWADQGMVTISGGKLTTFPMMAKKTLKAAARWLDAPQSSPAPASATSGSGDMRPAANAVEQRLLGRYGSDPAEILELVPGEQPEQIGDTGFLWAELRWAARQEQVVHLEDLLMRRTRLGLLLPEGGAGLMPRIRETVQNDLGWDDARWNDEADAYRKLWSEAYSPALLDD